MINKFLEFVKKSQALFKSLLIQKETLFDNHNPVT